MQDGVLSAKKDSKYSFVFSYGSNMNLLRLIKRVGEVSYFSFPCTLHDMQFKYNAGAFGNEDKKFNGNILPAYANIVPAPITKSIVYGTVSILNTTQLHVLDTFEGFKADNPKHKNCYIRQKVEVYPLATPIHRVSFHSILAYTYIATSDYTHLPFDKFAPTKLYENYILKGARQFNFPNEYINKYLNYYAKF